MIEVERKYVLDDVHRKLLLEGAVFDKKKVMRDVYYDTQDYRLTTKDIWLRKRGNQWELKVSLNNSSAQRTDFYNEIEVESEILKELGLPNDGAIEVVLAQAGYVPFVDLETTRETYKRGEFSIDFDTVRYQDGSIYLIAEIEIVVASMDEVPQAEKLIDAFVKEIGLSPERPKGKVIEYLYKSAPQHYDALLKANAIRT